MTTIIIKFRYLVLAVICSFIISKGINASENCINKPGDLTVIVTGFKNDKGTVIVKLFNSKESYILKDANAFMEKSAEIKERTAVINFNNLNPGEYSIKLFHDENGNGIHDKNFIGIPKEDYAFSNNATGTMGPPDYDKVKFTVKDGICMKIDISGK